MAPLVRIVKDRWNARRLQRRGASCYAQGDFEGAIDSYTQALALEPDHALSYYNLGLSLYKSKRRKEARDAWESGLALAEGRQPYLVEQFQIVLRQFG